MLESSLDFGPDDQMNIEFREGIFVPGMAVTILGSVGSSGKAGVGVFGNWVANLRTKRINLSHKL